MGVGEGEFEAGAVPGGEVGEGGAAHVAGMGGGGGGRGGGGGGEGGGGVGGDEGDVLMDEGGRVVGAVDGCDGERQQQQAEHEHRERCRPPQRLRSPRHAAWLWTGKKTE